MGKPVNVRIVRQDGSELPCELVHLPEENGIDMWGIAGAEFHLDRDEIRMDVLPGQTGLRFVGAVEDDE